jgi:hypothetical protein
MRRFSSARNDRRREALRRAEHVMVRYRGVGV